MGQKCDSFFETSADYGLADVPSDENEPLTEIHAAIRKVQQSQSHYAITCLEYISALFEVSITNGNFVRIYGWTANSTEDFNFFNVWFFAKENDLLCEFHWVIDPNGFINPVSELAQAVMTRQKAKTL